MHDVALLVALVVSALFLLPSMAEAQDVVAPAEDAQSTNPNVALSPQPVQAQPVPAQTAVVEPGESLWSISQERLGPNASAEQVASEVKRIFELNQERVGGNPNLVLVGQELMLEPAASEPAMTTMMAETAAAPEAAPEPSTARTPPAQEAPVQEAPVQATTEPVSVEPAMVEPAPETAPETASDTVSLPDLPQEEEPASVDAPGDAPAAASVGAESPTWYNAEGRRLLGLGIMALTLLVAILIAWRLPMNRGVREPEAWGMYQGYYANYALRGGLDDPQNPSPTNEHGHSPANDLTHSPPRAEDPEEAPSTPVRRPPSGRPNVRPNVRPNRRVGG